MSFPSSLVLILIHTHLCLPYSALPFWWHPVPCKLSLLLASKPEFTPCQFSTTPQQHSSRPESVPTSSARSARRSLTNPSSRPLQCSKPPNDKAGPQSGVESLFSFSKNKRDPRLTSTWWLRLPLVVVLPLSSMIRSAKTSRARWA